MKRTKKKLKLNTKNTIILIISIIAMIIFLNDWKVILFDWKTFTYWGIITNLIMFVVAFEGFEYLNKYATKKELKKKSHR